MIKYLFKNYLSAFQSFLIFLIRDLDCFNKFKPDYECPLLHWLNQILCFEGDFIYMLHFRQLHFINH